MPLPLLALPAIIGGVQALAGGIGSMLNKRPKYNIPAAQNQNLVMAQLQASSNMPSYAQAQANVGTVTGNVLNAARESGNPLAALSAIQANQNKSVNDIDMRNAEYQDQKQMQLREALQTQAEYQDQQWQINKFAPYNDRKQLFQNLIGSGIKNVVGGLDSMNAFSKGNPLGAMKSGFGGNTPSDTMLYGAPKSNYNTYSNIG